MSNKDPKRDECRDLRFSALQIND